MKPPHMNEGFARSLRAELVARVRETGSTDRYRKRLWIGAGVFAGAGLLGGIGAAAAGLLVIPGADVVTELSGPVTVTRTGSGSVELGPPPEDVTHVSLNLACLTAGTFYFEDGANMTCSEADLGGPSNVAGYTIPITPGTTSVTIRTDDPAARWRLEANYVQRTATEWGVNANGQTYGAANEDGSPDLVAVIATTGKSGYVYGDDLNVQPEFRSPEEALAWQEAHQGEVFSIPVYEADGETVIGEFIIGP